MMDEIIAMITIFVVSFGGGELPIMVGRCAKRKRFQAMNKYITSFSAGVFIALLCANLPESFELATEFRARYHPNTNLPVFPLFLLFGIVLICIVHYGDDIHGHSHSGEEGVPMREIGSVVEQHHSRPPTSLSRTSVTSAIKSFKVYLTMITIHSLIEGLPIGVKQSDVWAVLVPMCFHKFTESMSLGLIGTSADGGNVFSLILAYSAATPVGIATGFLLKSLESNWCVDLAILAVHGISNGAILFITFIELLVPQLEGSVRQFSYKMVFLFFGWFLSIVTFTTSTGVEHGHAH